MITQAQKIMLYTDIDTRHVKDTADTLTAACDWIDSPTSKVTFFVFSDGSRVEWYKPSNNFAIVQDDTDEE